jgi:hypothetical protein
MDGSVANTFNDDECITQALTLVRGNLRFNCELHHRRVDADLISSG